MATPVSASSSPIKETPQNEDPKEHPRMKAVHIILMIVILAMSLAAYSSVFGLHFSQTKIDKNGQNVFEQHKTKTIDSVDSAIRIVHTFPDLVNDVPYSGLSNKMFETVSKELNVADIKKMNQRQVNEPGFDLFEVVANRVKNTATCRPFDFVITDRTQYVGMLNKAIEVYNQQQEKITQPIVEAKSKFDNLTTNESTQKGRLSKKNMEGYSGSMTTMLTGYKTSTVKRDDYYIKSFNNQIDLQNSSIFHQLIFIIVSILIGFVLYGIQVGTFVGFTKESISPKAYKLISNILIGICGFFVLIYLIFAVLGSIGMSPFAYQCELQAETQKTNSKFQNFHGEAANLRSITSECKKGETVYSKMSPYLDNAKIGGHLNSYQKVVKEFATTFPQLNFEQLSVRDQTNDILKQRDEYVKFKTGCLDRSLEYNVGTIIGEMENATGNLATISKRVEEIPTHFNNLSTSTNKLIDDSFADFRNTTGNVVNSINSQLQSTDISCQIEKPPELCIEYEQNLLKITLINWIIFGGYVILLIHSILLHCFSRKMIREVDESNAAKEQLKKQLDDEKKKTKEQADEIRRKEEQAAKAEEKQKEEMQKKEDELEKVTEERDSGQNRIINLTDKLRKQEAANNKAKLPSIENNFFGHPRARSV